MQPIDDMDPLDDFPEMGSEDYWYELEFNRSARDLRRYLSALTPSDPRTESVIYIAGRRQLRSFIPTFIEKALDHSLPEGLRSEAADALASVVRPADESNVLVMDAIERLWQSRIPYLRIYALIAQYVVAQSCALDWAREIMATENAHEQEIYQAKYYLENTE